MIIRIINPRNVYTLSQAYYQIKRLREDEARERQLRGTCGWVIHRQVRVARTEVIK